VDGETVVAVEDLSLGYNHKGIEKSLENRWWSKGVFLSERTCGICGNFHTSCFVQGVENLLGIEIPERAKYIRVVISELERIHSHLLALGLVAHEMGLDTLFHYIFRDREIAMDLLELLTGNRVHFSANVIGGVRKDIDLSQIKKIESGLDKLEERMYHYIRVFEKDMSVKRRIRKVGFLSEKKAKELTPVGPNVRASGIRYDIRELGYFAYGDLKFKIITGERGDVLERVIVRFKECLESIKMIQEALLSIPKGKIAERLPLVIKIPENKETFSRVEAPRGELAYYIKSAGDRPYRVKIRTPTYSNFHILEEILKGYQIADVPVTLASIDPCMSCTDRVTLVDMKGNEWLLKHDEKLEGAKHD
jgi:NADH-quinone oxidoreductase subunit D